MQGGRGRTVNHADAGSSIEDRSTEATHAFVRPNPRIRHAQFLQTRQSRRTTDGRGWRTTAPATTRSRPRPKGSARPRRRRLPTRRRRRRRMSLSVRRPCLAHANAPARASRHELRLGGRGAGRNYSGRLCLCRPANANQKCPRAARQYRQECTTSSAFHGVFLHAPLPQLLVPVTKTSLSRRRVDDCFM